MVVGYGLLSLGCFIVGVLGARKQGKGNAGAAWNESGYEHGEQMEFISARASGKDEDTGVGEAAWVRVDGGLVARPMVRVAAGASRALRSKWEEEGGGTSR